MSDILVNVKSSFHFNDSDDNDGIEAFRTESFWGKPDGVSSLMDKLMTSIHDQKDDARMEKLMTSILTTEKHRIKTLCEIQRDVPHQSPPRL